MIRDLKDLWIGDKVRLTKSGRVGVFKGIEEGKAKIDVQGKIVKASANVLELYVEKEEDLALDLGPIFDDIDHKKPARKSSTFQPFNPVIDLHMEVLAPHLLNEKSNRIIDIQMDAFRKFLEEAVERRYKTIKIIHGKGEGKLMAEIHHFLDRDQRVGMKAPTNQGGATDVWLK